MTIKRGMAGLTALLCALAAGLIFFGNYGSGRHTPIPSAVSQAAETTLPPVPTADSDWRPAKVSERKAVTSSISAQLQAFRKNDYNAAVIYQSSALRQNFPSVDAFRSMMQRSYPQFTNYRTVQFGPVRMSKDGRYAQAPVTLTGKDGTSVDAIYLMVLENKVFRVESVLGGASPTPATLTPRDTRLT